MKAGYSKQLSVDDTIDNNVVIKSITLLTEQSLIIIIAQYATLKIAKLGHIIPNTFNSRFNVSRNRHLYYFDIPFTSPYHRFAEAGTFLQR